MKTRRRRTGRRAFFAALAVLAVFAVSLSRCGFSRPGPSAVPQQTAGQGPKEPPPMDFTMEDLDEPLAIDTYKLTELGGHMLQPKIRRGGR